MATVLHYRSLALEGRELSLGALLDDLSSIALGDKQHASLAAYFIGRSMANVAVSTLLYQSDASRYTALVPVKLPQRLNVMALAAERLEVSQSVEQVQQENPNALNKDEKNSADEAKGMAGTLREGDHVGEARTPTYHESKVRDDAAAYLVSNRPGSHIELTTELPTPDEHDSNDKATTEDVPSSSLSGVDDSSQSQELNAELKTDLFQQTAEDREPVVASGKSKRSRKKTDKTAKNTSASDKSEDKSGT